MQIIPNYPHYYAFKDGRIWSVAKGTSNPKGKFLKYTQHHAGYPVVSVVKDGVKKQVLAHKLIALAFIANPNNFPTVNHKNGVKSDNRVENLEWCSVGDNVRHAERLGLRKHNDWGENNTRAKLTNRQAREIKIRALKGENQYRLAKEFNTKQAYISNIKLGKIYGRV